MTDIPMSFRRLAVRTFVVLAFVAVFCGAALQGHAARGDSKLDLENVATGKAARDPGIVLTRGMADIVDLPGDVADLMVANPSVVDVQVLQSNRLYLVGVNYGTTNVIAVNDKGDVVSRLTVHVKIDDVAIQNAIDGLFPDEDVDVSAVADQIIVKGHVGTPETAQSIASLVAQYAGGSGVGEDQIFNMMTVSGEQQVMLRVKVVEAARSVLKELGIETSLEGFGGATGLTGNIAAGAASALTSEPLGVATLVYDNLEDSINPINMTIQALETEGLINTLAEPNLTAISGEQAGFLAGGEVPVPGGLDANGQPQIEFRPFGVALNFRPTVMSGERISLQLQTEVSAVSNQNELNGIPSFTVRRASTTVEMASGGSLMIAGLLQSDVTKDMNRVPGIGSIPVIGKLLSSDSFQRQESEMVVIVTAYLVSPYADKKGQADVKQAVHSEPLASAFAENIRRTYQKLSLDPALFDGGERYGYLID